MQGEALSQGTRASALWGRGSKGDRRQRIARGAAVIATAALAFAAAAGTSSAATAPGSFGRPKPPAPAPAPAPAPTTPTTTTPAPGNGNGNGNGNGGGQPSGNGSGSGNSAPSTTLHGYTSTATYPAGSLLGRAQANPQQRFKVIIQLKTPTLETGTQRWAGAYGQLKRSFHLIDGISVTLPGWTLLYIADHPQFFGAVSITEDAPVSLLGQTGPSNWQSAIGADKLWSRAAVTCPLNALGLPLDPTCTPLSAYVAPQAPAIAIVDSGIDPSKAADFGSRVVARVNFANDSATGDPEGHGTMVAGVAAGAAHGVTGGGVAQNAPLVDLRVASAQGEADTSNVIAALDWVLQNHAHYNIRVVNLSLAGNVETSMRFDPLDQAVERLWLNGIVVVAAAGNNGSPDGPTTLGAPGNDPFVITVGAVDTNGTVDQSDDFRAPWSAYGHTADGFFKPELSAPGRYMVEPVPDGSTIATTVPDRQVAPGYYWMSGTSFAAPAVAGVAADLLALHPSWTPDQVKGALMASATKLADNGVGIGELNAPAAAAVVSPPNPNDALDQFVQADPSTGLDTFNADAWTTAATAGSWTSGSWTSGSWTSGSWTSGSWTSGSWTSGSWTSGSWTSSSWVN